MTPLNIWYALSNQLPHLAQKGFAIGTPCGELIIDAGSLAERIAGHIQRELEIEMVRLLASAPAIPADGPLTEEQMTAGQVEWLFEDHMLKQADCAPESSDPAATEANLLTTQERRQQFADSGESVKDWAKSNGFGDDLTSVYRVLNDQSPARRGKHHEIAVKLGLKPAPACAKQQAEPAHAPATTRKPLTPSEVSAVLNYVADGGRS